MGNRLVVEGIHIPEKGNPGTHSSAEDIDHIRSAAGTDNSPAGKDIHQSSEAFGLLAVLVVAAVVGLVVVVVVVAVGHFAGIVVAVVVAALVASGPAYWGKRKRERVKSASWKIVSCRQVEPLSFNCPV